MAAAMTVGPQLAGGAAAAASEIPRRKLGRTGELVSALGLGGAHIGTQRQERESIRIIRAAVDGGITFLDDCWDYNGGQSESRTGWRGGGAAGADGRSRRGFTSATRRTPLYGGLMRLLAGLAGSD